jgi:hypothetical protein
MSWLPDSASFHEKVQAAYAVYRGRGLSLADADIDLVDTWEASGAPFDVIARGLRLGAEALAFDAPAGEMPRIGSLRAFRRTVEAEIKKYLKASAGRGEAPPSATTFLGERHRRLLRALKDLAPQLEAALAEKGPVTDFDLAERREQLVLAALWWRLPAATRRECLTRSRRLVDAAALSSATSRKEALRYHRGAWVRRHLQLPAFW